MLNRKLNISLCNRNLLIILITTAGLLPIFILTGGFYPDCDAGYQILPMIIETKRMLSSGLPLWSWDTFMGDNFIGGYMYYTLTNPFALLNCLFPYRYIGLGFIICLYLKLLTCGFVADRYFREIGFSKGMCVLGSVLYTFSTWGITNIYYYIFVEPMILFPILLIATERLIKGKKYGCTVLMAAVATIAISNCYFIPCELIPGAIYFFCRIFCGHFTARQRTLYTAKAAACVIVGILAAAVAILPIYCHLQGSERMAIHTRALWEYYAQRFQTLFIPTYVEGPFDFVLLKSSWSSNAATIAVFGCLPAILMIFRRPKAYISIICLILILIYITPANGIFSLFTNSDYSRWAFALTLFLTSAMLYYFKEFNTVRLRYAICYSAFCCLMYLALAAISLSWYARNGMLDNGHTPRIVASGILLLVNLLCLIYICRQPYGIRHWIPKALAAAALCAVINMQMFVCTVSPGTPLSSKTEYNVDKLFMIAENAKDFNNERVHLIHDSKDATLFNWGLVAGCQGTESFHSLRNPLYSDVAYYAMYPDDHANFLYAQNQPAELDALMSVRHICQLNEDGTLAHRPNPNYIPMGFAYDRYRIAEDMISTGSQRVYNDSIFALMLDALLIERADEDVLSRYLAKAACDSLPSIGQSVTERRAFTCDTFSPRPDGFTASITLPQSMAVFFSVVADKGFTAYVDDVATPIYTTNLGFSTIVVPEGSHTIRFKFIPRGLIDGLILTSLCLIVMALTFFYEKKRYEKNFVTDSSIQRGDFTA